MLGNGGGTSRNYGFGAFKGRNQGYMNWHVILRHINGGCITYMTKVQPEMDEKAFKGG